MSVNLPRLDAARVLVCGDLMLDRYWNGPVGRISPEAPVPVVRVTDEDLRPGGAANVAVNVKALGAACTLVGLIGDDAAGAALEARLEAAGVVCHLIRVPGWETVTKLRVTSRRQQLLRLDFERPLPEAERDAALETLRQTFERVLPQHSVVLFSDYAKGTLVHPEVLVAAAVAAGAQVIVDPKSPPFSRWQGADVVKPNLAELEAAEGPFADPAAMLAAAQALVAACRFGALLVTQGEAGMTWVPADGKPIRISGRSVEVFDVTGAGDTVTAALGVALAAGVAPADAARLANLAGSIAVSRPGTAVVSLTELTTASGGGRRVLDAAELAQAMTASRGRGERIVFTNGCFDVLHAGHVGYLEQARALGDRLVVAINGDASVRRLKGAGRPLNPAPQRARVLAGLAVVDWVVVFDEDTPEALLELLRPDVLAKGGDYRLEQVVGADVVHRHGGEVRVLDLFDDLSTSALLERLARLDD